MQQSAPVVVKVWGDYACFSRPEFKVERVSYPVITPSAARGVLEALFWKPEFVYEIREIGVLNIGTQVTVLRNELSDRQGRTPIFIEDQRQQRSSLVLKNVAYLIKAEMVLRPHGTDPIFKYRDQFNRRVQKGQCHHTPYLGTREFAASFAPPDGGAPLAIDQNLGVMLFDVAFIEDSSRPELLFVRHGPGEPRTVRGYAQALFFSANLNGGWLDVPADKYRELRRLEGGHA